VNRRLLIQVSTPAVVIGVLLLGVCLASGWYINRLQKNMATILSQNVASLQAAQGLELHIRQLRYHSFVYLIDPRPERLDPVKEDNEKFEEALLLAKASANDAEKANRVRQIEQGYQKYREELALLRPPPEGMSRTDLLKLADRHPTQHVVEPCRALLELNTQTMNEAQLENDRLAKQLQWAMLFLGLMGPVSGLIMGYGIARGLSRSIYRLSVRVQDMAQRLDRDVASISISADGDIHNLDKQLQHVVLRVEEVAERLQRHQREMLRAEQLSAVGRLAASVAHEIRNPLTAVKMLVEVGLRPRNPKSLTADDLRVIHGELVRVEQIVQNLLDFARLPLPQKSHCDLRQVISQTVELIQARARQQQVKISLHSPPDPVEWDIDRNQFCTVLINLFLNALDAMPQGGNLDVELEKSPTMGIRLAVSDTGGGIAPQILDRLFVPFASTKPTGTGLGLSISKRIVEEHGGYLSAQNRPDGGARFIIALSSDENPSGKPNELKGSFRSDKSPTCRSS
jgi:signal transduction histidine kinase